LKKDVEAADRSYEVRAAARAWNRAGAIDEKTLDAIQEQYPDDRSRVKPAFRVLLFLFTFVAVGSAFAVLAFNEVPIGALLFLAALGSIALTEVQIGELRRSSAGAEEATALLSFWFSVGAIGWVFEDSSGDFPWRFLSVAAAVLAAVAAWRWGLSVFGALAAVSLFLALSFWSGARTWWVLAALAVLTPLLSASVSPRLAPSHRRAADAALVTVLAALYLAVHLGAYDAGLLDQGSLFGSFEGATDRPGRSLHIVGTAVVPLFLLAGGVFLRRPLLLRMGVILGVASLVTLRFYVHVAPLWIVLLASGGAAVAVGMLLNRYLASGPGRERHGFTAEPLFGEGSRARVIEAGLGMALAPGSTPSGTPAKPGFEGAGGEFGGGGASGKF
jgi:hypothetical protein